MHVTNVTKRSCKCVLASSHASLLMYMWPLMCALVRLASAKDDIPQASCSSLDVVIGAVHPTVQQKYVRCLSNQQLVFWVGRVCSPVDSQPNACSSSNHRQWRERGLG